jgi:hypothetical protein
LEQALVMALLEQQLPPTTEAKTEKADAAAGTE